MQQIKAVLWDVDGTLLDFHESEVFSLKTCFALHQLGDFTDEMLREYRKINRRLWRLLEEGRAERREVLEGRFEKLFSLYGLDTSVADRFNADYQIHLSDRIFFFPKAQETLELLRAKGIRQYAVTNGTAAAQRPKLAKSGLDRVFDAVFISEEMGAEKPAAEFFDKVFEQIGDFAPHELLIVGDSLTSDIRGGNNAGLVTCWFNPDGKVADADVRIDHEIRALDEVAGILG